MLIGYVFTLHNVHPSSHIYAFRTIPELLLGRAEAETRKGAGRVCFSCNHELHDTPEAT